MKMNRPDRLAPNERIIMLVHREQMEGFERVYLENPTDIDAAVREAESFNRLGFNVQCAVVDDQLNFQLALRPFVAQDTLFVEHRMCMCNEPDCTRSRAYLN